MYSKLDSSTIDSSTSSRFSYYFNFYDPLPFDKKRKMNKTIKAIDS